jgi:hypothetical protein
MTKSTKSPVGRAKTGGGMGSRQHVKTPVRTGQPAKGVNPGAVSYLGGKLGNHTTESGDFPLKSTPWKGTAPTNAQQILGNEKALRASGSKAGPGADRTIHKSGAQGQHGPSRGPEGPAASGSGGPGSMGFPGKGR